jgi:type II secretory pathway component GspD/PulD (secretin)
MREPAFTGAVLIAILSPAFAGAQNTSPPAPQVIAAVPTTAQPGRRTGATSTDDRPSLSDKQKAMEYFLAGARAFEQNRLATAEREFVLAHKLDPTNQRYPQSAEAARQFMVAQLLDRAASAGRSGNQIEAQAAFSQAKKLDAQNPLVTQYMPPRGGSTDANLAIRRESGSNAPIELEPEKALHNFHLWTNERELIPQVLGAYGIRASVDQSLGSRVVPFNVADVAFPDALRLVKLATDSFVVALDAHHVLVLADTRENRRKYQPQVVETVYFPGFPNLELSDMESIARNVLGIEHAVMHPSQGTITLRAPESDLTALNHVYGEFMEGRSEVQLDMHVYEVDRSKETNSGVVLPNSATLFNVRSEVNGILANNANLVQEIISSGEAAAGDWQKIIAILIASGALSGTVFNSPFVVFGGGLTETGVEWNTTAANMLLSSSDVKSLNQIQLRVTDQEEATFRVGERYPIMTAAYSILSGTAYSSSQTTPQVQYTDLGLTLKAKPYVEGSGDVTLHLDLEVDSLAGSSLNDIPVLTNRQYSGVVSVHPGNSAMLVSAISRQDSLELTGMPGLSDIPGFGDATNRENTTDSTELVILITPHVVRIAHRGTAGPMQMLSRN